MNNLSKNICFQLTNKLTNKIKRKQTTTENTQAKLEGNRREHLSKAFFIGLSNIFDVDLTIIFKSNCINNSPNSFHNLIVSKASICKEIHLPDKGKDRQERRSLSNEIFNNLSEFCQRKIIEIITEMKVNDNQNELQFTTTKKRRSEKTISLNVFQSFEPFNSKGFELFAKKTIEIVVNNQNTNIINKRQN